jgi:hypothetical protein
MAKFVGVIRKIKPADVKRPRVEHAGWRLSVHGPVDFYDLVVPYGARVAHVPVSVDSDCIIVEHGGERHYFLVSGTSLTGPDVIEPVPPERCRTLI